MERFSKGKFRRAVHVIQKKAAAAAAIATNTAAQGKMNEERSNNDGGGTAPRRRRKSEPELSGVPEVTLTLKLGGVQIEVPSFEVSFINHHAKML